ncbi:putative bifunctional diguanylate cyclase/phosphodiesterase [Altererythrobacter aquiaggeris]|uniref:putative bifunctional diguanylate cyclase/phosphodiesterase n=1 Tax=Aestuarierythrobacter aquiaggeris TaxID=1898396 RepID=UPI00301B3801
MNTQFEDGFKKDKRLGKAEGDLVALGIAVAAIILFLGTGSSVLSQVARAWQGTGLPPEPVLVNALLLNIALIIFGWRRYSELTKEIAERRKAEESARILSETDELTGCLNRRSIGPASEAIIQASSASGMANAFLMIDLDNFKQVNDLNGHLAGDDILQTTAKRITDELPRGAILARLGGDEFACLVSYEPRGEASVSKIAGNIIEAVSQPIEHGEQTLEVTVSVGISTTETSDQGTAAGRENRAKSLLHRADVAMYHAKKDGRNRYFWFESPMENELKYRAELEAGIRRGLQNDEFVPYFEQQIDLDSGELVGFEMLARWQSPELGLVGPDIFIPVAEDMGVIAELSETLISKALDHAKDWDASLTLSVNISPVQLRDPWFSQKILKLLTGHGFPPNRLEIEITESCLHENVAAVRTMITSLKNQGVSISLDDFGTGYSSLAQLRSLPFDRIKIDRSFVTEMNSNPGNSKIVDAIISLGEGLKLPITAEGIETEEVRGLLSRLGPLKGQGYLYGQPENAATVHDRLALQGRLSGAEAYQKAAQDSAAEEPATADFQNRNTA